VYSRIREIGVLRAYGMVPKDIAVLFTLEGLILGTFGSILGVVLGAFLDLLVITRGISLTGFSQTVTWLAGVLHGEWNPMTMGVGLVFGVLVSLAASLIPARSAARLQPTDAFRFQ
jgi:ABC-type lipoprotein release transport system permease subunit